MKLQINESSLISNLGAVFSSSDKFIPELLQNGRRAGATQIKVGIEQSPSGLTVTFSDDGCGIEDFQHLFTVADSGWSDDVKQQENPYGMGALAMLFAADEIKVQSNGRSMQMKTSDVLEKKDIGLPALDANAPASGTSLTLMNVKISENLIVNQLKSAAKAFSIPVSLNGEPVPRPLALENVLADNPDARVYDTEFGKIVILGDSLIPTVILQDAVIYQGVKIARDEHMSLVYATHEIKARMPDRDAVINEKEVIEAISKKIKAIQYEELVRLRKELADDVQFVLSKFHVIRQVCPEMLNDINALPAFMFSPVGKPSAAPSGPLAIFNNSLTDGDAKGVVHRDSDVFITEKHFDAECSAAHEFAYASNALTLSHYDGQLDPGHWIYDKIIDLPSHKYRVTGAAHTKGQIKLRFNSEMYFGETAIGDFKLENTTLGKSIEIKDAFVLHSEDRGILEAEHDSSAKVFINSHFAKCHETYELESILERYHDYDGEYGDSTESVEEDALEMSRQIQLIISDDIVDYFSQLLKSSLQTPSLEALKGRRIELSVKDGSLVVTEAQHI